MLKAIFPDGIDKITVYGLTQWDIGQQLQITLASLPSTFQVHFASKRDDVAYVVEGTSSGGVGTVNIPNILLQNPSDANAWIYIGNTDEAETIKTICLPITPRAKPSDYTYEETEILNYNTVIAKAQSYANAASLSASSAKTSEDNASNYANTANEAKNYVEAIVAGNEAYTKYESSTQYGSVIVQKASGSPILIKDSSNAPVIDFKGYGGSEQKQYSGKNLAPNSATSQTINGVVFTKNDDGSIKMKGTSTATVDYYISRTTKTIEAGTYVFGSLEKGSTAYGLYFMKRVNSSDWNSLANVTTSPTTVTLTEDTIVTFIMIQIPSGVTVDDTVYPMISVEGGEYEPYVGGASSPNPSYPQRINAVGDKGWFDGELLQGYYDNTGTFVSNTSYVCNKNKIYCNANDEVKLSYGEVAPLLGIYFYDKNDNVLLKSTLASTSELIGTAPTNVSYFRTYINSNNVAPTTAKHISVTINGKYALIVKEQNKNLLNIPSSITLSASGYVFVNKPVSLKANKTYTFSFVSSVTQGPQTQFVINYSDGTSQSLSTLGTTAGQKTTQTFTPTKDVISATYYSANAMTVTECMIEEGTVATDYVPHESHNTYIPISAPLRSSLDGSVEDEVYKVDGKYIVERKFVEKIVTNTNAILHSTSYLYISSGSSWVSDFKKGSKNVMSEYYRNNGTFSIVEGNIFNDSSGNLIICDTRFASADEAKTWFDENPMRLIAQLATPTIEVLDQAPFYEMRTFDGVTHITSEADMEVSYATDTKTYIDSKIAEIQAAILNLS